MHYPEYVERFRRHAEHAQLSEYGSVLENGRPYPLLYARTEGEQRLVITAGFHGEEPAGPLTLLEHLPDIVEEAKRHHVGLSVYPCVNPSGFESGSRYNASGEHPNNDFLRYEVKPGVWKGELEPKETFLRYTLFRESPKETRQLLEALEREPTPNASLDIHQDRYLGRPLAYFYVFGARPPLVALARKTAGLVELARDFNVDEQHHTDAEGLIESNDGSVTDYFLRRGAPFNATLETTTQTPMHVCHAVNLLWIRGFIELAAQRH